MDGPLVVATYNIRRAIGRDGRQDVGRIARVIEELDADLLALQEVDSALDGTGEPKQFEALDERLPHAGVPGVTLRRADAAYGNACFSRLPVLDVRRHDLSVDGVEPRGVLDTTVEHGGEPIRVLATHLGLGRRERRSQTGRLAALLDAAVGERVLLAGDFNEWRPLVFADRQIDARLGRRHAPRSWPARWPIFRLDRIWADHRAWRVERIWAHGSPAARVASDHLPVCARIVRRARGGG